MAPVPKRPTSRVLKRPAAAAPAEEERAPTARVAKRKGLTKTAARIAATKKVLKKPSAAKGLAKPSGPARRIIPLKFEQKFQKQGLSIVAGTDEAGRGPLAGPVVAAAFAVLGDPDAEVKKLLRRVTDSKAMTAADREEAYGELIAEKFSGRIAWAIAEASVQEIDGQNILQASLLAMARAVKQLQPLPNCVLVDGCNRPPDLLKPGECWTRGTKQLVAPRAEQVWLPERVDAVIHGDAKVASISAASVLAKVHRDRLMHDLDQQFPEYGFASHKGYGTKDHIEAIKKHGVCPAHRRSFAPVSEALGLDKVDKKANAKASPEQNAPAETPPAEPQPVARKPRTKKVSIEQPPAEQPPAVAQPAARTPRTKRAAPEQPSAEKPSASAQPKTRKPRAEKEPIQAREDVTNIVEAEETATT